MLTAAVIVAAGRGVRAGGGEVPKQYRPLAGRPVLAHSLAAYAGHPAIGLIQVVIHPYDSALYAAAAADLPDRLLPPVAGGADRQASVLAGLEALAPRQPDRVLIHDAARPFATAELITRVLGMLDHLPGAIAAAPVTDTLKRADAHGLIGATLARDGLWRAQTPQGFHFAPILAAHRQAAAAGERSLTDDAAVAERAGLAVALVPSLTDNRKLTTPEDFLAADRLLQAAPDIRTGSGFDVHRFTTGDHVILCGVRVSHDHGVDAHSDGDVALHALTDALLGAIGAGDIGQHFPPSEARWKGAASALFVAEAMRLVRTKGGQPGNVDITILCERPRVGPYREAMRAMLAEILGLSVDRVNVKATTTEMLGFTGRGEGLAAMATATVFFRTP